MTSTAPSAATAPLPSLPEPRAGGFRRALLVTGLAAGITLGWLHLTRIERWLAQVDALDDVYDGYRRHHVLEWLDAEGAADDPRITAAFVREIVRGAASVAPPSSYRYEAERALEQAGDVLQRRRPQPDDAYLKALLTLYGVLENERCVVLVEQLGPEAHARLRELAAAEVEPRARLGALLLVAAVGAGSPDDAHAILTCVEAENPPPTEEQLIAQALAREDDRASASAIDAEFRPDQRHEAARRALLALGEPVVDRLRAGFQSRSRAVANLCARVLKQTSLATLITETEKRIDEYAESGARRPAAENVVLRADYFRQHPEALKELEAGAPSPMPTAEDLAKARELLGADHHLGNLVAEVLQALVDVRGDERVDLCFMRALSSPNEAVAKFCARELRQRLTRAQFADALFRFLAHKGSFWVREIDVYEDALEGYGADVSADIVRNLEALLRSAGDEPGDVFWIHKAIALRCLSTVGTPNAYDVLRRYAADRDNYVLTSTNRQTGETTETQVWFHDLARQAAEAIATRSGVAAPELPPRPTSGGDD